MTNAWVNNTKQSANKNPFMVEIESFVSLLLNKSTDNAGNKINESSFILYANFAILKQSKHSSYRYQMKCFKKKVNLFK